jgi:predicted MFS family arabinose efflux permease
VDFGILRERPFRLVFGAHVVSLVGDGIVPVALAFAVLDLSRSPSALGIVLAARTVPLVVCVLAGGVVADRRSRRQVMIAADLVRLVSQGLLGALLVSGAARVWEVAALQAVLGGASGFFNPAASGIVPMVVSGARLQEANALRGIAMAAGQVAGPAIGGVLVATVGAGEALLLDAASYAASAALLARVRVTETRAGGPPASFFAELREGWGELVSRTWVWTIIAGFSLANFVQGAFSVLGPVVAKRELGGVGAWATILACRGAGQVIGGVAALRIRARRPLLVGVLACEVSAAPLLLLAPPAPTAVIAAGALASGAGVFVFLALWETALQRHIPLAALSRVSAYDWFGSLVFAPLGLALAGPVAAGVGIAATLWIAGALELVSVGALLAVRDIRRLT